MSSLNQAEVRIRFFTPAAPLRPYISTYYLTEVASRDGEPVQDYLHPEWANLRFFRDVRPMGAIGNRLLEHAPAFTAVGPTSRATRFAAPDMLSWGIGLLPLGWQKFIAASAEDYADRSVDGDADPAFAPFRPLRRQLFDAGASDVSKQTAAMDRLFLALLEEAPADNAQLLQAHSLLVDPELATVQDMASQLDINGRALDRLSRKAFGFPPKLLLRRQRFLRSLAANMLNPDQNWVSTLDQQYYDQAHFGRDFKRFMGMSARAYKALPHPFMNAAVHGRLAAAGAGMQVLHDPKALDKDE